MKKKNELFQKVQDRIKKLTHRACQENVTRNEKQSIEKQIHSENEIISKHLEYIATGAHLRSKTKWYIEGEKSTKFFLGLEKTQASNKTIKALRCEDNTITRDQKKILAEQLKFYRKLYTKNPNAAFVFQNETTQKLSDIQKEELATPFTFEEFTAALKGMAKQKTPGIDGLSCEFYIMFFKLVGQMIWNAMLLAHKQGHMYKSARRGVISLIPKKHKDPLEIKGWCPLTLLCVDCKIVTRMLSLRIKKVISVIVQPQQTGYVPGRDISYNIRKLIDMLMYLERENIPAIVITIDFEKCFNSLSHEALFESMKYFNIGDYFISWVKMIYTDFELCVTNNRYQSRFFTQTQGVHQGCAFSGPGFLLSAEILAINIKNNKKIKGVPINGTQEIISQYADDTTIISAFDAESLQAIIDEFETFYQNTGLKVNYDKSIIYRVGAVKNTNVKLKTTKMFKWSNDPIDILGVLIQIDSLNDLEAPNFTQVMQKATAIVKTWAHRRHTILGKIEVCNSLISSLFVYRMQVLPMISRNFEGKITELLTCFI